ncbi:MAG: nucleoside triphosphate pyrophosphohydrolase [Oligoflexia bacterium]|nr:nucleoside triphosphate pyrophosphohydrolase [Oligoflexia bacterium]
MPQNPAPTTDLTPLAQLIQTVHRLRAPGGCPWDRAQTHQSLRQYLIEESHEVLDVLDRIHSPADLGNESLRNAFREELGDVLMQVVLHAEMTREAGHFDFLDVARTLNEKLIRRHPHVFGEVKATDADSAFASWEKQKAQEKAAKPDASTLDGLPRSLPALQRTARVIEKVTKVGFQWNDMTGPLAKLEEELAELKAEVLKLEKNREDESLRRKLEHELGDVLFSVCNVGYLMKANPEDALRGTLGRFERRFRHVERRLREQGKLPEQSTLEEMDRYWDEAKALERAQENRGKPA